MKTKYSPFLFNLLSYLNFFTKKNGNPINLKKNFTKLFIFKKTTLQMCLFGNEFNSEIEKPNKKTTKK